MKTKNIWFILGLSGAGKTYFSNYLAKRDDLLHMNIDHEYPVGQDKSIYGIDFYGFRPAWELFEQNQAIAPLVEPITKQYQKAARSGAVLSFPSTFMIGPENIIALKKEVKVVYMAGSRENCLRSFLQREEKAPQVPAEKNKTDHWNEHNKKLLQHIYTSKLFPYTIDAFVEGGARKSAETIYSEIKAIWR